MGILSNILKFISDNSNTSSDNSRYKSPSGGYMNYAMFSVKGVNSATNRKKALKFECKTADVAKQLAINAGLINIESVTVIPFDPPSIEQIDACRKHSRNIPVGACKIDVSFLMTKDIEDEKDASLELIKKADELGVKFSYLTGKETLQNLINEKQKETKN